MTDTSEVAALADKLGQLHKQMAAIQAAEVLGRRIRRLLYVGVLVFLVGFGWLYYQKGKSFISDANIEKLSTLTQDRLTQKNTQARIRNEIQILLDKVQKPVTDAFTDQAKKDSPKFAKSMNEQGDRLLQNLPVQIEKQVNRHYYALLTKHVAVFAKEFPELTNAKDKEEMIESVAEAVTGLSKKYYAEQMQKESEELLSHWRNFPVAARAGPGDPKLEDKLMDELLEFMWLQIAEISPQQPKTGKTIPSKSKP